MGGNALKTVVTVRKSLEDYNRIKLDVLTKLGIYLRVEVPHELSGKTDFGDLDVLYSNTLSRVANVEALIRELFHPREVHKNGDVISFDYDDFQIDLIKCSSAGIWDFNMFFFSYGDIGSLIGRIANHHHWKFGIDGFWCNIHINDDITQTGTKVMLTQDPNAFCDFFGLDYNIWKHGFQTVTDIFEWIIKSKYFTPNIFKLINLNHTHRDRVRKRKMYTAFLTYISHSTSERKTLQPDMSVSQSFAIKHFGKMSEYDAFMTRLKDHALLKSKFSGKLFLPYCQGKDIGIHTSLFEKYISKTYQVTFNDWVKQSSVDKITQSIHQYFQKD